MTLIRLGVVVLLGVTAFGAASTAFLQRDAPHPSREAVSFGLRSTLIDTVCIRTEAHHAVPA
jgi:hypothetical protein